MGFTASVLGASGYAGGELLRLLEGHPAISCVVVGAHSQSGTPLEDVHPHLNSDSVSTFGDLETTVAQGVDVCFSCLPAGVLGTFLDRIDADLIIDLADDHRADPAWTYGLTEYARSEVARSKRIANPGCYPTAALLGLVPFVRDGIIGGPAIVDAMSGVSGAGKGLGDPMSFSALHGNVGAYGSTTHRHVPEMEMGLGSFGGEALIVSFTPHLVPMARGLLVTARALLAAPANDDVVLEALHTAYGAEEFVSVISGWPATKSVLGTNRALVAARVDAPAGVLVASVAIDNLGKGAAGQALQNAYVALGLEESSGLDHLAVWP